MKINEALNYKTYINFGKDNDEKVLKELEKNNENVKYLKQEDFSDFLNEVMDDTVRDSKDYKNALEETGMSEWDINDIDYETKFGGLYLHSENNGAYLQIEKENVGDNTVFTYSPVIIEVKDNNENKENNLIFIDVGPVYSVHAVIQDEQNQQSEIKEVVSSIECLENPYIKFFVDDVMYNAEYKPEEVYIDVDRTKETGNSIGTITDFFSSVAVESEVEKSVGYLLEDMFFKEQLKEVTDIDYDNLTVKNTNVYIDGKKIDFDFLKNIDSIDTETIKLSQVMENFKKYKELAKGKIQETEFNKKSQDMEVNIDL